MHAYGIAARSLALTAAYCRERETFGKPLIANQVVQHKLVEMHRQVDAARIYTRDVAARHVAGEQRHRRGCLAKQTAVEACDHVVDQAVQLHGGTGYMHGTEVERHYRDARILGIGGGATEVLDRPVRQAVGVHAMSRDTRDAAGPTARESMLAKIADLDAEHAKAVAGGGEKYVERHHARGKLMPRERIELLVDPGSAFLELSPLAGWGSDFTVGASVVTGIGVIEGVECMITANDPSVKGGASNPWTVKKIFRASQIAEENRLPTVALVESGGADLPTQKEIFIPGGKLFRDITRSSAAKVPTIALVFGNSTAGGAYVPGHERLHRDGQGAGQGVPRWPAAGEDGHRRGVRRRVARRRRDARAHLGARGLPRRRRVRRPADRPPDRGPAEPAEAPCVIRDRALERTDRVDARRPQLFAEPAGDVETCST